MGHDLDLDGLQRQLWSFAGQRVITVAGRAGILDSLADQPATPDKIANDLDLDPFATGKVIRALTALGLVEPSGDAYRLTAGLRPYFGNDGAGFAESINCCRDHLGVCGDALSGSRATPCVRFEQDALALAWAEGEGGERCACRLIGVCIVRYGNACGIVSGCEYAVHGL